MGNTVIAVPSEAYPLITGDLYQVFDTSDLPGGAINIVTGYASQLLKTLAEHDDVDAIWSFGDEASAAAAKAMSVGQPEAGFHQRRSRDRLVRSESRRGTLVPRPRRASQKHLGTLRRVATSRDKSEVQLMKATHCPRVKICCISSVEEAALAVEAGASALGLVSHMPSGPGVIGEELIAEIAASVPPAIGTFLLTCRQSVGEIVEQQHYCRTNTVQICDHLTTGMHRELKNALPGISIVQVIHVTGPESVEEAEAVAPHVNAILLDSGNQKLAVKELGGTGRKHDWTLSRMIRERVSIPIFLAGWADSGKCASGDRRSKSVRAGSMLRCAHERKTGRLKARTFFRRCSRSILTSVAETPVLHLALDVPGHVNNADALASFMKQKSFQD